MPDVLMGPFYELRMVCLIVRIYCLCSLTLTFYVDHLVHSMPASRGGPTSSATVILSTIWLDFASKRICIQLPNQSLQCFGHQTTEFFTLTDASLLQTLVWNCSSGHDVQHMLLALSWRVGCCWQQRANCYVLSSQRYLELMVLYTFLPFNLIV